MVSLCGECVWCVCVVSVCAKCVASVWYVVSNEYVGNVREEGR